MNNTCKEVHYSKMAITIGLLILFCLTRLPSGYGQAPPRPKPSESSIVHVTQIVQDSPNTQMYPTNYFMEKINPVTYRYTLCSDYNSGNMLYVYPLGKNADCGSRNVLLRDDLSTTFEYYEPFGFCTQPTFSSNSESLVKEQPSLQFQARWTWLNEAKYSGSEKFHGRDIDLWTYTYNDSASMTSTFHGLGVTTRNPNVPLFYFMYTAHGAGFTLSVYDKYINGVPIETVFNIPTMCHAVGSKNRSGEHGGQKPVRPKLAESFSAEIMYVRSTFYINEAPLKLAKLYRNYDNKKQLQVNPLGRATDVGSYHQLLRVDQNKQYNFFEPFRSCHITGLSSDSSGLNQPMWGWIKNARFSGVDQFRHQKINMWTYTDNTTSIFYSLGVSRRNPNMPIFLYEMHTYYTYRRNVTVFEKYKPGPPHKSVFKIPKVCSEK